MNISPTHLLRTMRQHPLVKNAVFLMASAGMQAVLGFGFWLFVAHLYSPSQIGVASALIAITAMLTNFSMLGVNSGLLRFLSKAENQSRFINAAIILVGGVTMAVTAAYVIGSSVLGLHIPLLYEWWQKALFVLIMTTISINALTDSVFIANRRAEFHTAGYTALGLVKLVLPLILVAYGATGVFASYVGAVLVSLVLSFILMRFTCNYSLFAKPDWSLIKKVKHYALHNYIGVILGGLPSQIMPVLILHRLSADDVAYFSIAWTMVNLVYVIPSAVSQSMLAESAYDLSSKAQHIRGAVRVIILCLIPVVAIGFVVAPHLLGIFGHQYTVNSVAIFEILIIAAFSVAINEVSGSLWNIEHRTSGIVMAQFWNVVVTIGSALYLLRFGLAGAGLSLVLGMIAANISHLAFFAFQLDRRLAVLVRTRFSK